jgi:RNA polymerase sigma-B factor
MTSAPPTVVSPAALLAQAYYRARSVDPTSAESRRLRSALVSAHMGLARKVAHRKAKTSPESYEDLEQIAVVGLITAINRYNPFKVNPKTGRVAAFSSFAMPYVDGEIGHFERDDYRGRVRVPRAWLELHQKVQRVKRQLAKCPTPIEMAEEAIALGLGCDAATWQQIQAAIAQKAAVSFESLIGEPAQARDRAAEWAITAKSVQSLREPHRTCVVERFWAGRDVAEIAAANGWAESQVEEWLSESEIELRRRLEQEGIEE